MNRRGSYIVVENAGMIGEVDIGKFGTMTAAWAYINSRYSESERDRMSPCCLYPDVCFEEAGMRTYDI